jgi:hypothetical protein
VKCSLIKNSSILWYRKSSWHRAEIQCKSVSKTDCRFTYRFALSTTCIYKHTAEFIDTNAQWKISKFYKGPYSLDLKKDMVYSGHLNCSHMCTTLLEQETTQIKVCKVCLWPQSLQEFPLPHWDQIANTHIPQSSIPQENSQLYNIWELRVLGPGYEET